MSVLEKVKASYLREYPYLEVAAGNNKNFFDNATRLVCPKGITPLELYEAIKEVYGE